LKREARSAKPPIMSRAQLGVLFALVLAPACASEPSSSAPPAAQAENKAGLPDRDPALAHRLVASGGLLIDVRTPEEYAEKHAEGAINIPVGELDRRLAEVEKLAGGDKKKPIVVYCAMGGRAAKAKSALTRAGYEQVTNVGGLSDYERK
jgi:rhodanese-related sulfurtransferase